MIYEQIKIVGVCGSVRAVSTNLNILRFIKKSLPENVDFLIYEGLAELPHFNPDLDAENSDYQNAEVEKWRKLLREADAVIFCTPEYAHGVPGVLKNALDWIVSSGELVDKPTAIITASPSDMGGANAMASLLATLKMMSAKISENTTLMIPLIRNKLDQNGDVSDRETVRSIKFLLNYLVEHR